MSLTTAVRSLNRSAKQKFPGASDSDIAVYLGHVYTAAAANLVSTYKDEQAVATADKELTEAAERGEAWAVNLRDSVLVNIVKPIVDNAVSKGVDPVTALVLKDFSESEAREYVAALEARTDGDDSTSVDLDVVAGSDEADTDPYAGTSADAVGSSY